MIKIIKFDQIKIFSFMETMAVLIFGGLWNWISWAIFGVIAGALAKWIMPGKDPGGFFVTMLIGIGGAILGGWLSSLIFEYNPSEDNWSFYGFVSAVVGSLLILFIWKKLAGNAND